MLADSAYPFNLGLGQQIVAIVVQDDKIVFPISPMLRRQCSFALCCAVTCFAVLVSAILCRAQLYRIRMTIAAHSAIFSQTNCKKLVASTG